MRITEFKRVRGEQIETTVLKASTIRVDVIDDYVLAIVADGLDARGNPIRFVVDITRNEAGLVANNLNLQLGA